MKNIEQKAQRYDEALEKARTIVNSINVGLIGKDSFEAVFPELKEDYERIKKEICKLLWDNVPYEEAQKYINCICRKQPSTNSREYEEMIEGLNNCLDELEEENGWRFVYVNSKNVELNKVRDWLKSLKDRVQPKQEWSKDDEQYLLVCKNALAKYQITDKWDAGIISRWLEDKLKSLRPHNRWKPSDEQIKSLEEVINAGHFTSYPNALETLYEQLKQL